MCAHVLNLGELASPTLDNERGGVQMTLPVAYKVGKAKHTAHIALHLTITYLGEGYSCPFPPLLLFPAP